MTGRPRGSQARTQWLRVRLTPDEESILDHYRGSKTRSDFMRGLLRALLDPTLMGPGGPAWAERAARVQTTSALPQGYVPPVASLAPTSVESVERPHRHKPSVKVGETWVGAVKEIHTLCECGHDLGWRRA